MLASKTDVTSKTRWKLQSDSAAHRAPGTNLVRTTGLTSVKLAQVSLIGRVYYSQPQIYLERKNKKGNGFTKHAIHGSSVRNPTILNKTKAAQLVTDYLLDRPSDINLACLEDSASVTNGIFQLMN